MKGHVGQQEEDGLLARVGLGASAAGVTAAWRFLPAQRAADKERRRLSHGQTQHGAERSPGNPKTHKATGNTPLCW